MLGHLLYYNYGLTDSGNNVMLILLMYESFLNGVSVCEGGRGLGLHLSLDYLRNLFIFLVSNQFSDFKSNIAVQPNILTSVKLSEHL